MRWSPRWRSTLARALGFATALAIGTLAAPVSGLALAAPASAPVSARAAYLTVASLTAPPGGTITIAGNVSVSTNCPATTPAQITATPTTGLFPNGLGPKVPRDANGNFTATFVIPATATAGSYTIGVLCGTSPADTSQTLVVSGGTPVKPTITASTVSAKQGQTVTVTGGVPTTGSASCPAGDAAQLTSTSALFPPDGFGPQGARDSAGHFQISFTVPAAAPPGAYTIGVRCGGGNTAISVPLQVVAAAATTTTSAPSTTTTTVAPTSTTTSSTTATTTGPTAATTVPFPASVTTTTRAQPASKSSSKHSSLRWIALAVFVVVVLAAAAALVAARR